MASRTTEQERRLHILTVNVRGLKTNADILLKELEKNEVDVVLLTETKIGRNAKDTAALRKFEEKWKIFPTRSNSSSKGAAILLNKERDFRRLAEIVDESGRYVIVSCWISGRSCTFVSVYHHADERGLLKELSEKIKPLYTDILVVGGDFNTTLDEKNDRMSLLINSAHNRIRKELKLFMDEHDLIDAWREKHPGEEQYTYEYRHKFTRQVLRSRIDYFFINADKWGLVKDCRINQVKIADHWSVSLILDLKTRKLDIFSSTVHDLPSDEVLAELRPDIILLTKGEAEDDDYIKKLKEEERKVKKWNVLWSDHSNAAILVTKRQRGIHILFTVHKEDYVILHCIVLGMLHTFVSVYHPTKSNLKKMLREIIPSNSGRKVIGGDFSTSEQTIIDLMNRNEFNILESESTQSRYLIHAQFGRASEIEEQTISGRLYSSLTLHSPEMTLEDVDNITRLVNQLQI